MPEPLRLDLPVLLPDLPDARDACVRRLTSALADLPGISRAHVAEATADAPPQLCLHYDPAIVDVSDVRRVARREGARITERWGHVTWEVSGLTHQRRARTVARRLEQLPGVAEARANATGPVHVEFDRERTSESDLRRALDGLGVTVTGGLPAEQQALPALRRTSRVGETTTPGTTTHPASTAARTTTTTAASSASAPN